MRVDVLRGKLDALRGEQRQHLVVRRVEIFVRVGVRAQAVLVADDDEFVTGVFESQQCGNHARHQLQFLQAVHLLVLGLGDQRAVAVHEQDPALATTHRFSP